MPENNEPTIESLQAQILEMNENNATVQAELAELKKRNTKLEKDLADSREINSKLWKGATMTVSDNEPSEPEPETENEFIDSFIKPNLMRMRESMGDKKLGSEMFGNED